MPTILETYQTRDVPEEKPRRTLLDYYLTRGDKPTAPPIEQTEEELRYMISNSMDPKGFIETTLGNTTPGLAARTVARLIQGEDYLEAPPGDFGPVGNIASEIGSLMLDPVTYAGGAAGARLATGALGRKAAEEGFKRGAARGAITGATTLGALTGAHDPLHQFIETGDIHPLQTVSATVKSAFLGAALGPAGRAGKLAIPAEVGVLGAGSAAMEGRIPTGEDFAHAAGLVLGLKGAGLIAKYTARLGRQKPGETPRSIAEEVFGEKHANEILQRLAREEPPESPKNAKERLMAPEGAATFAIQNPELAFLLSTSTEPHLSRGRNPDHPFYRFRKKVGIDDWSRSERDAFREQLRRLEIELTPESARSLREESNQRIANRLARQFGVVEIYERPDGLYRPTSEGLKIISAGDLKRAEQSVGMNFSWSSPRTRQEAIVWNRLSEEQINAKRPVSDVRGPEERRNVQEKGRDDYQRGRETRPPKEETSQEVLGALADMPGLRDAIARAGKEKVPERLLPDDPEMSTRVRDAMRPPEKSFLERIRKPARELWHKISRAREHLPETKQFASANAILREFEVQGGRVGEATVEALANWSRALRNTEDKALFTFKLVVEDQLAGLRDPGGPQRIAYGSTPQKLEAWKAKLDREIAQNPSVQAALDARRQGIRTLVEALVADGAPREWLDNVDHYYHREVNMYRDAERYFAGGRTLKKVKKGFEKARKTAEEPGVSEGEWYDPSTNWVEAEAAWVRDALITLDTTRLRKEMARVYDILPRLKEQAKETGVDWKDLIPDTHGVYSPPPGHTFYRTHSVSERIAEAIQEGTYRELNLKPSQVREVVALGKPQFEWVVPKELVQQLDSMAHKPLEGSLGRVVNRIQQSWKQWQTSVSPKRTLIYGLNNLTGDLDPVIAAIPSALRPSNLLTSWKDLWNFRIRHREPSDVLKSQRERGVIGTGQTDVEVEALGADPRFARLLPRRFSWLKLPRRTFEAYANFMRNVHTFREDWLRSATDREYLRKLNAGEKFSYGASKKEVIDGIRRELGNEAASAKLTLDLIGNYQDRSAAVRWNARYLVPFARWTDINLRREPRLIFNLLREAYEQGKVGSTTARITAAGTVKASVLAAKATALFSSLYTGGWLWNHLLFPELEAGLSEDDRSRPHLIIGERSDGSPVVLRNLGALGAFLDFTGIQRLAMLVPLYLDKQITAERLVKDVGWEVANNTIQMVGPYYKMPVELATQRSYFPDVRHPREATTGEVVFGGLGLADEYKEVKGRLMNTGERGRPGRILHPFPTGTDIRRTALSDAYSWRERFLDMIGRSQEGTYPRSAFKTIRESAQNDDYQAFTEAVNIYLQGTPERKRTYEDFTRHLGTLDPLDTKLSDSLERRFLNEYLRPDQANRVREARDYAYELRQRLWWWFRQYIENQGTPEQKADYDRAVREHKDRLRKAIRSRTVRQRGESLSEFKERRLDAEGRREKSRETLEMMKTKP